MQVDSEREAHRDEVIRVARELVKGGLPTIWGVPNAHAKALKDEIEALDTYESNHRREA
jgi:hypothetical protein